MKPEVTCILTSCGRFDLLRRTLESFFVHNTYDIKEFIIYEDSPVIATTNNNWLYEMKNDFPFVTWHLNSVRRGQIFALDQLWSNVKTPYAFTMEDDWEFLQPGFIEASLDILQRMPNILQTWLQPLEPHNVQQIEWITDEFGVLKSSGGIYSGTRFNPGLKRKKDYDLIAPFSHHTTWNAEKPWKCEADISKVYHKLGFKGGIFSKQYIRHIGEFRHVGP